MLLELRSLSRDFAARGGATGSLRAVDGVDLDVAEGEVVALVGESGSGKSTVARIVLGLLEPSAGEVRLRGRDLVRLDRRQRRAARREIQAVFQDPYGSLDPRWEVGASIAEPLVARSMGTPRERRERVRALLEEVGLGRLHETRYPHELSGGERQRVALARALASDPRLLVADEPASALDAPVRGRILALLAERQRERGLAMLLIAHDLAAVRRVAGRVAVMQRGRIVEEGRAEEVLERPAHAYTRALLEASIDIASGRRRGANAMAPRAVDREAG